MLVEQGRELVASPLGAVVLATGTKIEHTASTGLYKLDGGVFVPRYEFVERIGFPALVPFKLDEIAQYKDDEPEAGLLHSHLTKVGVQSYDGWTTIGHLN